MMVAPNDGHLGNPFLDGIVERQPAVLLEQHEAHRRELLRDGGEVEARVEADRRVVLEIGHTVCLVQHQRAFLDHSHGTARRSGARVRSEYRVDPMRHRIECRGLRAGWKRREQHGEHGTSDHLERPPLAQSSHRRTPLSSRQARQRTPAGVWFARLLVRTRRRPALVQLAGDSNG